ncbi:nickel-dependent hydrogenase large subunit [Candidatus Micrarchaeota archaeon]|nr:nickel-dependent hydrogenase large subunit [Candidatus Micrarchaeota archaeon]
MDANIMQFEKKLRSSSTYKKFDVSDDGSVLRLEVSPSDMISLSKDCVSAGALYDSAFISLGKNSSFTTYYVFRVPELPRILVLVANGKEFHSITSAVPAAILDERKMQDLTGLKLQGIPDSRALIFHPEAGLPKSRPLNPGCGFESMQKDYPMVGTGAEGEFEIPVGPVHAGIIEPGHFRFQVVGEPILKLEARLFFLHRGLENIAEGKSYSEAVPLVEQIAGDETIANTVAYVQAVESFQGMKVPTRAKYIRTILMELERIYSHLADLGGMPTDVGFYLAASRFAILRESMMRLNMDLTGSRFLRGICTVGGLIRDLDDQKIQEVSSKLHSFLSNLDAIEVATLSSSTFIDRAYSTGTVPNALATELALVGPAARAAGVSCDVRIQFPYAAYDEVHVMEAIERDGDVLSRFLVKINEVKVSAAIVLELIEKLKPGPIMTTESAPKSDFLGFGWSEAPRGSCMFMVEGTSNGRIKRLAVRTASFKNWRAAEKAVLGNIVPDFPLVNKSFNLAYAGNDL